MSHSILVVGCGSIGERHLRCFQRTGRAVVAACEPNPTLRERMARDYGVEAFASLDDALAGRRFNGVVVATPAHTHLELAAKAIARGGAVLIEKPLSTTTTGVVAFIQQAQRSGLFAAVAYVYHAVPGVQALRHELRSGALGKPLHVTVTAGQHFPTFRPAYREIYYTRHETGGGAIQDALTHLVNAVEWLVGPATRVYAEAAHQCLEGVSVEDTVCVAARHGDVLASYALNQFQAPNEIVLHVHCEGGSLAYEHHAQRWGRFARGAGGWEWQAAPIAERDTLFIAQANTFLDGIEGKPTPLATLEEAAQTLRFNLAALESAHEARAVVVKAGSDPV
ncbi:MAG: Gfo/Idh/MocA family oxidoreductase [Verrucomicrobia bacterium]|nr:Gfo/Idh/MocA family oxidoreductase [Verrucomicrobiota bacterium]